MSHHESTLAQLRADLDARRISARELTEHFLGRIDRLDGALNTFITLCPEQALAQAEVADQRIGAGEAGPLTGIPFAHKDIFCTRGVRTTCASRMLADFVAPYDATVHQRLEAAGAVLLGKTNMDEFAMGSSNENSHFGAVRNPWDPSAVPGGSSGGSAAAVAARLTPLATGTDTGGSIRQPAAFCGITGIKPTYGRVSRYGMIAYASSLDQGGAMAASAEDCSVLLAAMAGFDPRDSTSVDRPVPDYRAALDGGLRGLRIGLPKQWFSDELEGEMASVLETAIDAYRQLGAEVREVDLPNLSLAIPAYYVIAPAEASSNLSRYDGVRFGHRCEAPRDLEDLYTRSRSEGFGEEVKRRILIGTYALSEGYYDAYYLRAQRIRRLIADDFARALADCDVLMGPVTPTAAFDLGSKVDDPVQMYLEDVYTLGVNLAGLPALSLPVGQIGGRPVGLQVVGRHFDEARLLNVAHGYQRETDWHRRLPPGAEA
ncbi:MAG: Asp-tRNA(Asn)/Glu-tRNA(Gln) amidotransferase subunit GatA [Halothiobacillaceae bacterium]